MFLSKNTWKKKPSACDDHVECPPPSCLVWNGASVLVQVREGLPAVRVSGLLCLALVVCIQPVFAASPPVHTASPTDRDVVVLVAYYSASGNTEAMAHAVAEGARSVPGTRVQVERVEQVMAETLFSADAVVIGSPVYWANMAGPVKTFFDNWQLKFGIWPDLKLRDTVGAVFTTGGQVAGGQTVTMLTMLAAMLGNQMIVVSGGGPLGASAVTEGDSPGLDEQELATARALGVRVADVTRMVRRGQMNQDMRETGAVR